ncbi:MAG: Ig-like domain-containing protein [Burkholderiales bacterium]|nr:Ig-like domain-containing protein [Nitrosomonas sp.]MCP5274114.1 Ig-like domain-containing protein [Burkholderiales bacterium]
MVNSKNSRNSDSADDVGSVLARPVQARDDHTSLNGNDGHETLGTAEGMGQTFSLDVLANDSVGRTRALRSTEQNNNLVDSGSSDFQARNVVDAVELSALGAQISITDDGKVSYTYTPELLAQLLPLSANESLTDTFTYAIQMGNGVVGWAAATVEISGVNDPPVLSGMQYDLADGEVNNPYMIYTYDLLSGFTDPDGDELSVTDLTATNGTLTEADDGWVFTPDTSFTGTVELQYNVIDGHGGSVPATQNFMIEETLPVLVFSTLSMGENIKVDDNIVLDFDEKVVAGNGDIIISNGIDTHVIDVNDTSQVTFTSGKKGGSVIIDPTEDLIPDTSYNIQMASDVIQDATGNSIDEPVTLNFTPIASNPILIDSIPRDESNNFKIDNPIGLFFDEPVVAGSGAIIISNGTDTRTIDINDASQVTFDDFGGVIIDPTDDLTVNSHYTIQMTSGVILDSDGFPYAGIGDLEAIEFTTVTADPLLSWSNPVDGMEFKVDGNIELVFDERVVAGSGEIIISNGTDTRTIDINDTSQVMFDGYDHVTIDPIDDLLPDSNYNIQMVSGVIVDANGHAYAGISAPDTLDFMTIPSNPRLVYSDPMDEFTAFQVDSDIRLDFDEPVVAGSGTIIISNGTDTRTIDVQDTNQVAFDGFGGVIINPFDDLIPDTTYNIQMASGVLTDLAGHAYAGIGDPDTLNFTTIPTNPVLDSSNPQDEAAFKIDDDLSFYFNEMIMPGSGNIIISNGADTRTIDIHDASQVMFDGYNGVVINPADDLVLGETYHVLMDSGVITDMAGHAYAGISDPDTLNFTTISPEPSISVFLADEYVSKIDEGIWLYFDEDVMPGSGAIVMSNGTDTRTIDINDSSQVTFSGSKVTITPVDDLIVDTHYNIQMAAGVIQDTDGHEFAGISDPDTYGFTTISSDPRLNFSEPSDDLAEVWVGSNIYLYFDETVTAGSGDIIISNGTDTRLIDVGDTSQVMFDGFGGVTINPASDLVSGTDYNIQMASGVIIDPDGNPYEGIDDAVTLNFTTTDSTANTMAFPPIIEPMFF